MSHQPLQLRRIEPDNAWLSARNAMIWQQPDSADVPYSSCRLSLCAVPSVTSQDIEVITDHGLLRWHAPDAFCLFFSDIDPAQTSHPAQHQAFWQAALTRWPVDLLNLLGHPALAVSSSAPSLPSAEPLEQFFHAASLQCHIQDHQLGLLGLRLSGEAATLRRLITQGGWQAVTTHQTPDDNLPFSFPVRVAELKLDRILYQTLARGDVLRLPEARFQPSGEGVFITALNSWAVNWDSTSQQLILQDLLPKESFPMSLATHTDETSALQALPVHLTISLGSVTLTLAEWRNLTPGAVLPLAQPCPPRVQIQANGVWVGTGELVELAGSLAVQLTDWP